MQEAPLFLGDAGPYLRARPLVAAYAPSARRRQ